MALMSLYFLGPLQVILDRQIVTGFESDKARALLVYLAMEADWPQERTGLARLLWPDLSEKAAHNNLRGALTNLRRMLNDNAAHPQFLISTAKTLHFNRGSDHWLDVNTFTTLLTACDRHRHRRIESCFSCAQRMEQAAGLYRGDFLAHFSLPNANTEFNEWVESKRRWLARCVMDTLVSLSAYHERRGSYRQTRRYALRQLDLDPLREEAYQQIMRLLAYSGERSAALAEYHRCRRILAEELGLEPGEETTVLYQRIRTNTLHIPALVVPPTNLPTPPTPLIGRDQEVVALHEQLLLDEVRLVALTGAPGIGKTRLSLEVANNLRDTFEDGSFFINLAPIRDHQFIATTISQALGLQEMGIQPLMKQLKEYLRDKQLLLILDNFEHVLMAAPLIAELLAAAPDLKVLVTSRAVLHLSGAHEFSVPQLQLPDLKHLPDPTILSQYAAIALFVARTRASKSDFQLTTANAATVAQICIRLEGLPLAIELAAARSKLFTPEELLLRLSNRLMVLTGGASDLPTRQQTLRNTLEWSFALLNAREQMLFMRLGVFVGGCTVNAIVAVCNATNDLSPEIIDGMATLVDQSLLRSASHVEGESRFMMLETLREYALEQLEFSGEADIVQRQHAAYYLELAEQAEPELTGPQQKTWLARLEMDHDNLRAALSWAIDRRESELAMRLVGALWLFWYRHGYLSEARRRLEEVLAQSIQLPASIQAKLLLGVGFIARAQGDGMQAGIYLGESLILYQELGDKRGIASSLAKLAALKIAQSEYEEAKILLEESLTFYRELGDETGISQSLRSRGLVAYSQGDLSQATAFIEESLRMAQQKDDKDSITGALWALGIMKRDQNDLDGARKLFVESIVLFRELGDKRGTANSLNELGIILHAQGDHEQAIDVYRESLSLWQELGYRLGTAYVLGNLAHVVYTQNNYQQATALHKESLALFQELESKSGIAEELERLAQVAVAQGQAERAVRLWGAAGALRTKIGAPQGPIDCVEQERGMAVARAHLDPATFEVIWKEGQTMLVEEAIAYALGYQ